MFQKSIVYRTGAAALALTIYCQGAVAAELLCAKPDEMTALEVAALRQEFMVAALTCHQPDSFNRWIVSHQTALQDSDRVLAAFFARKDGDSGYNAYKTRLANASSLRSLNDMQFCANSAAALDVGATLPLEQLATYHPVETGFARCDADTVAAMPLPTAAVAVVPQQPASQPPTAQSVPPSAPLQTAMAADSAPNTPPPSPMSYGPPYAIPAPYGYGYSYGPTPLPPMRQVQGSDGRWYIVPAYGP